jgi:hypothetical protein
VSDTPQQGIEALRDPAISLRAYGQLIDQASGDARLYDPHAITHKLQETIVGYVSEPPRTEFGQVKWLNLLGYRQGGKSLTAELCGYVKTAYSPGYDAVCIADNRERAEYLHQRVHYCHKRWPEIIRTGTISTREVRQLTFENEVGGKMRVLTGDGDAVGIGQSPDFFHGSELAYWRSAAEQYSLIYPSMINRDHALMILECTPCPMDAPSAEWWMDKCRDAQRGHGRDLYAFFPFWDGKLNQRPWPTGAQMHKEELQLMELYGGKGLTKENLAFRRLMMDTDPKIRRNPDLFKVYYPFDDVTCWLASAGGVIHPSLLKRHHARKLIPWQPPYMEYEPPEAGATYVIGVDPAGYAARDHAAFQVLKCYDREWTQVAVYAAITDPIPFTRKLLQVAERYNHALVGVESNGVGAAVIALLQDAGLKNLYHEKAYKPGIAATSKSINEMLSWLQDALKDELILHDADTVAQLTSYRHDKSTERTATSEALRRDGAGRGRRERHHWDKISALQIAVTLARRAPTRHKRETLDNVIPLFHEMPYDRQRKYLDQVEKSKKNDRRRRRASYPRRRK